MRIDLIIKNYTNESQIYDGIINKWINTIKAGIPIIIGVVGKSSHGKSAFIIHTQQKIYENLGLNYLDFVEHNILIKPTDYAPKTREIFQNPKLKNCVTIQMD